MHIHVDILMLCINFELIPIKFRTFFKFLIAQKLGQSPWYKVMGQKWLGENSSFL